jgi:hypothetical protein
MGRRQPTGRRRVECGHWSPLSVGPLDPRSKSERRKAAINRRTPNADGLLCARRARWWRADQPEPRGCDPLGQAGNPGPGIGRLEESGFHDENWHGPAGPRLDASPFAPRVSRRLPIGPPGAGHRAADNVAAHPAEWV